MARRFEKVLITGGTGFTGQPLAERLRQDDHDVLALGRSNNDHAIGVDLRNLDGLTRALRSFRPSAILHLAGIAAPTHGDLDEMYSSNVIGMANLFAAVSAAKVEPNIVIIASTAQVYASLDVDAALTEDCPLGPKSHYGVSKHAGEEIAGLYARDFPIIVARPFNYTGPGQQPNFFVPKIVQHYAERRAGQQSEIRVWNLDIYRDFSDISRVVEAYARLVSQSIEPTTVNICSGHAVYLADVFAMMNEISGHTVQVVPDESLFRDNEPRYFVGSPARLEQLVGALPNPEFSETLAQMYRAIRTNGSMVASGMP